MGRESTTTGHGIKNLCTTCLKLCFKKPKFDKLPSNDQADELKIKVGRQVCRNGAMLQFNLIDRALSTVVFNNFFSLGH